MNFYRGQLVKVRRDAVVAYKAGNNTAVLGDGAREGYWRTPCSQMAVVLEAEHAPFKTRKVHVLLSDSGSVGWIWDLAVIQ